jgi:hypothetical protein
VVRLLIDAIGESARPQIRDFRYDDTYKILLGQFWEHIVSVLTEELGLPSLVDSSEYYHLSDFGQISQFIQRAKTANVLDCIDLIFQGLDQGARKYPFEDAKLTPDEAINRLNIRFRHHSLGYEFYHKLIRIDSAYIHSEITSPTLTLLREQGYEGAEEEFMTAIQHYKKGENRQALTWAANAFESTMKTICSRNKWHYNDRDTASDLIKVILGNNLLPSYLQDHLYGLPKLLQCGAPTVRNKNGPHGQGEYSISVPDHMAAYAVNLAGSNILFLVKAQAHYNKASKK